MRFPGFYSQVVTLSRDQALRRNIFHFCKLFYKVVAEKHKMHNKNFFKTINYFQISMLFPNTSLWAWTCTHLKAILKVSVQIPHAKHKSGWSGFLQLVATDSRLDGIVLKNHTHDNSCLDTANRYKQMNGLGAVCCHSFKRETIRGQLPLFKNKFN